MKAERRHELRENDLVHALGLAREYFEKNSGRITLFAVAALAVFAAVTFALRSRAAAHEDVWRRKNQLTYEDPSKGAQSIDRLMTLVAETSDPQLALEGLLDAGRQALRLAREVPFPPDRELNNRARKAFEELLRRFPNNPLAVGVALSGLATVAENDFMVNHDPACKSEAASFLERLSKDAMFNGLPFQRMALDRLKSLDETFQVVLFQPPLPPEEPVDVVEAQVDPIDSETP